MIEIISLDYRGKKADQELKHVFKAELNGKRAAKSCESECPYQA